MLTEERFAKILSILESMGSVTVQQLMTELNASESTIRRDLNALDANGQLTKVHGGAILKTMAYSTKDDNVVSRKEKNRDAKNKIAKYAAEQIAPGDFVYLDAGTTTELMIEYITSHQAVFVTNAISHAKRLAERGFTVYLLGGEFKAVTEAIVGEEAVAALEKYNFTKGFWGANGVSLQKGYSTPELKEAMVKKKSMENCKECFVLADESKFNQISSVTFAPFEGATVNQKGVEKMIYTVTFNPSLDYIVSVDNFTCGIVNRTTDEIIFPGGKGINVSMVLKNLGFENTALGFLAGFTGNRIQDLLEEKGVRADFISVEKGISRINVKLRSNEETEINGQGPAIAEADIKKLYEKLDTLSDGDILVLAGSIPDVMPGSMYMDIMRHLQNKDLKIVVDATKDLLVNVLQYHPFLIKPNNHELGEIFGVKIESKADVITYAKKMQEKGARNVLVSMAGDGAVLVAEDGSIFQSEAPKGKVVNSVGAGDSMVAGFIAGYLEDGSYGKAFQMGVCTGSASAFSEELATKAEVIALLDSNKKLFAGEQ